MNKCLITYKDIDKGHYSRTGLNQLNTNLKDLRPLPFDRKQLLQEADRRSERMSIQGGQPKLSAILSTKEEQFKFVDKGGRYILKPPHERYECMAENEDLTMKLAHEVDIEVPDHGLVLAKDDSLVYWIRRFDRVGKKDKLAVEDFGQLMGKDRETKYKGSMEQLVTVIDDYCTFPVVEKRRFFLRTLFCWLTGNEDMHLKNWSVITRDEKVSLSPAYDMLNSALALNTDREFALPLKGKKSNFTKEILLDYWGKERLELTDTIVKDTCQQLSEALHPWETWIHKSFLPAEWKEKYWEGVQKRASIIGLI